MSETLNELVTIPEPQALEIFTNDGAIDPYLDLIREAASGLVADATTEQGRKEIKSMARKVARSKTYLDEAVGKKLATTQKEIPKKIDACRRHIRETLDQLRDDIRFPVTQWEEREKARKAKHLAVIEELKSISTISDCNTSNDLKMRFERVREIAVDDRCEEYQEEYRIAKEATINALNDGIEHKSKQEAEQAELERLRAEAAERERVDREEALKKAAADKAKAEAEQAALAEKEAAARREQDLKDQVEAEKRKADEQIARAKIEADEAEKQKAAEIASREADKEHRRKIHNAAADAIIEGGASAETARAVITMIATGEVPHVTINY